MRLRGVVDDGVHHVLVRFTSDLPRHVVEHGTDYSVDEDGLRTVGGWTSSVTTALKDLAGSRLSFALLGEPGIGKSSALRAMASRDSTSRFVPLDEVTDVPSLRDHLASTGAGADAYRTLVLDGLDECPLPPKTLARSLIRFLPNDRPVRLLIGCRTSEWQVPLGDALKERLTEFGVFELLPLSVHEIELLAAERGVDAGEFLDLVRARSIGALAGIPLTLHLLLQLFASGGGLPEEVSEIYENGLLSLADEPDAGRSKDRVPAGNRVERLLVAERIAATMLLCARGSISVGGSHDASVIDAAELSGGEEPALAGDFTVTSDLVTGALGTGLFTGAGEGRLGVTHASFAAYLAARYVVRRDLPEHQVRALLTRTNNLGRTSIPTSLREVAAWVVALAPARNRWLVDVDHIGIVAHAGVIADAGLRRELVASLLDEVDPGYYVSRRRWRLGYPGLADQLRVPLRAALGGDCGTDLGHPVARRAHTAVLIARASAHRDCASDLADLVAEPGLNPVLRASAAYALSEINRERAIAVLRQVLVELRHHPEHDPMDELRGEALSVCWPDALEAPELVAALTKEKRDHFVGSYTMFRRTFVEQTTDDRLAEVADAARNGVEGLGSDEEDELEPGLHSRMLLKLLGSDDAIRYERQIGWLLATCAKRHARLPFPAETFADGAGQVGERQVLRRRIVRQSLEYLDAERAPLLLWMWRAPRTTLLGARRVGLLDGGDLVWLFELGLDERLASHASTLLRAVFDPESPHDQQTAWAHREHPLFDDSVGWWFRSIELDGEVASQARAHRALEREWSTWSGAAEHLVKVAELWERVCAGDGDAFLDLTLSLWISPRSGQVDHEMGPLDGWPGVHLLTFDPAVYLSAAVNYLRSTDPAVGEWLDTPDRLGRGAMVGYRVLLEFFRGGGPSPVPLDLSAEDWGRWAAVIVRWSTYVFTDDEREARAALEDELRNRAPTACRRAYLHWTRVFAAAEGTGPDLRQLSGIVDRTTLDELIKILREWIVPGRPAEADRESSKAGLGEVSERLQSMSSHGLRSTARFLASHVEEHEVAEWISALIAARDDDPVGKAVRAVAFCGIAATEVIDGVLELAFEDRAFGCAFAVEAGSQWSGRIWPALSESQVGRLVDWLVGEWGVTPTDTGWTTPEDRVRDWRDGLIRWLAERATASALDELQRIATEHSSLQRIGEQVADAESRHRDSDWTGPTPAEFFALVRQETAALLLDEDDLYRAVLAALEHLRPRLVDLGELLWNEYPSSVKGSPRAWLPKYEPAVSAMLLDHLRTGLRKDAVVNREVMVRQTSSKGHGLAVDVLVDGVDGRGRVVTVPIEVKGCWNRGLFSDLGSQLVADYLPAIGAHRGIYVCAWFPTEQWSDMTDRRRAVAARLDRAQVAEELRRQATAASSDRIDVRAIVLDVPRPVPSDRAAH
ncbi:NACHT domain-containing protein [Pimelobacter simplex]|uniref:NACHT domain-containing protein n=1 Tax=Nocardioides simplex TaxID=2045 RepID=UPI003AB04A05